MSYKFTGQKQFKIDDDYEVDCAQQRTSYGFRHLVGLHKNGRLISKGKGTYHNRTWERYQYQSAIYDAIVKADLPEDVKKDRLDGVIEQMKEIA